MSAFPVQQEVEEIIRRTRASTPPGVAEQRRVRRASIAELNLMDPDEIRDRYTRVGYDSRSPIVRALDVLDAPRNLVANALFRGVVDKSQVRRGAGGMPVIQGGDALEALGVKNKFVRAGLGFVLDVGLDPLTYAGPAGWGLEAMSNAGRIVRIGKAGAKGLKTGIKEVSKGAAVSHLPTRELFDTLLKNAPDEIRAADNATRAAYLSEKALGKVGAETKAGKAFSYLSRGLGGPQKSRGGVIAEGLTEEGAVGEAVRSFVGRAGRAAGPGIGRGGSQIAHIPFTGFAAKVPAFTRAGRQSELDLAIARSAAPRAVEEIATPTILRARDLARAVQALEEAGEDATGPYTELANLVEHTTATPLAPQNQREIFALNELLEEAEAGMDAARARIKAPHNQTLTGLEDADELPDGLGDGAEDLADSMQDTFRSYQRYAGAVRGAVRNFAQNTPQEDMLARAAMRFLGTDDPIVGRAAFAGPDAMLRAVGAPEMVQQQHGRLYRLKTTIFGEKGSAVNEAGRALRHAIGPGQRRAINTYLGETVGALRKAFTDSGIKPTGEDLDEAATLLMALAVKQRVVDGAETGVYYTRAFGSDDPAPFLKYIESAVKSGKMAPHLNNGLMQRLEAIAKKYGTDLLDELEAIETKAGLLQRARAGYIPNTPTPAASAAISSAKAYQDSPVRTGVAQRAKEAFQKPRSMDQVRWKGDDGVERRLFRAELDQAAYFTQHAAEIEDLRREGYGHVADELQRLVDDYGSFNRLKEPPSWRNTDPFESNDLAKAGRFSMLLNGVDPVGGFFQTNMLAALANRIGSHERAVARQQWTEFVNRFGLRVPEFQGKAIGNKVIAADGSEARLVEVPDSGGHMVKGAMIGGQVYRPLMGMKLDNPLIDMLGRESAQLVYHDQVAAAIERTARVFDEPNVVLNGINEITRQWKNLTLLHPSWTIFNMIGDTLNALQAGANPARLFDPQLLRFAARISRYAENPEKLRSITMTIRGVPVSGEQILNDLIDLKVIDGTMMEEQALKMVENRIFTMPPQASGRLGKLRPSSLSSDYKDAMQRYATARGSDTASVGDKLKAGGYVASDRYLNNFLGPWFRMNQKATNYLRTQIYLSYLSDGFDAGAAARKTIESQFDYSDASRIESQVFRTLFPFYSWMRNNGAFQIRKLFEHPMYAAAYPKVQEAIESAIAGDEKVPQQLRPSWMRSALALQLGADPEKRTALLFGGGLPVGDLYQHMAGLMGVEGAQSWLHYFASSLNPVLSAPLQIGAGVETFSGRTIGPDAYSGDLSVGEFARNLIRPVGEVSKVGRAFGRSTTEGIGRIALGGRVQDFSEDRIRSTKLREFQDKERRIRAAVSRAERTGDKSTSLRARVKLLELYNAMVESGLEDEVPRWARPQLDQLNPLASAGSSPQR